MKKFLKKSFPLLPIAVITAVSLPILVTTTIVASAVSRECGIRSRLTGSEKSRTLK